jgi:hypothetical protein
MTRHDRLSARHQAEERAAARMSVPRRAATSAPGTALSAVPILRCADLDRTVAFYAMLGFEADPLPGYAVLHRDGVELHVSRTYDVVPGACLIHVRDVARVREHLRELGAEKLGPIEDEGTSLRGFVILDPDGNHIRIVGPVP